MRVRVRVRVRAQFTNQRPQPHSVVHSCRGRVLKWSTSLSYFSLTCSFTSRLFSSADSSHVSVFCITKFCSEKFVFLMAEVRSSEGSPGQIKRREVLLRRQCHLASSTPLQARRIRET